MASKITVNLDTSKENYLLEKCIQHDNITLEANIFENGVIKDLTGLGITINVLKPDGSFVIDTATGTEVVGNKITKLLNEQVTTVDGMAKVMITLNDAQKLQNSTFKFKLLIKRFVIEGAVASSTAVPIVQELTDKIAEATKVKTDTDTLIKQGGAATKGELQTLETQLTTMIDTKVDKESLWVNVKDYEHLNGTTGNWNNALTEALRVLHSTTDTRKVLYFPNGEYNIDPNLLVIQDDITAMGASEQKSIIKSTSTTKTGNGIQCGSRCTIKNLTVRDFGVGVMNSKHYTKIYDCILSYNTIGVHFLDSYIVKCIGNEITFNNIGVLVEKQSYQLMIKDNVIDNNYLGVGICGDSNGVIVSDNTIEGNRNTSAVTATTPTDTPPTIGCGMLICGMNQSRLEISGNWFESNGSNNESVDVFFSPITVGNQTVINMWTRIVNQCVPVAYKDKFLNVGVAVGSVSMYSNAFIFTQYGLIINGDKMNFHISDSYFKGVQDKINQHILIGLKQANYIGCNINIDNCNANNSDYPIIDTQVLNGVKGTYINVMEAPRDVDMDKITVNFNGENLFIKKIHMNDLISNTAYTKTPLVQIFASGATPGTEVPKKGMLDGKYVTNGFTGTDVANYNTTLLLGDIAKSTDATQVTITPNPTVGNNFFIIADKHSAYKYQLADNNWASVGTTYNNKFTLMSGITNMKDGKIYSSADGSVFYLLVQIPDDTMKSEFKGVIYVEIDDIDIQKAI